MKLKLAPIFLMSLCVMPPVFANDIVPLESHLYYQLGGGSDLVLPPVKTNNYITIGGNVKTNLGFACGTFDPNVSIANSINSLETSVEGLSQSVIGSAEAAVGSLPMYALEKSMPELYNLIQNAMVGAQDTFDISLKSCQQARQDIKKGTSPYQDWFSISDSQGWLDYSEQASKVSSTDINTAYHSVESNPDQYGVPWVHAGQNSGGDNQTPIHAISDVVVAGYNVLVDPTRPLDSDDAPPAGQSTNLTVYWPTPDDAGSWAKMVLGDMNITTSTSSSDQATTAGIGLSTLLTSCPQIGNYQKTCVSNIEDQLASLVTSGTNATPDELRAVSASNLVISQQVINAIRNQDNSDQSISVSRLAQDVATQNLVEEALMMRRVLSAGAQTQVVLNLKPATSATQKATAQLNSDINDLMFEHDIRQKMMTNSLQTILSTQEAKEAEAINQTQSTLNLPMTHGAVYKQE